MHDRRSMGEGSVARLVLAFSVPSVAGMLVNGLYNVADRIFVGRGVGPDALAGVAVVFPVILIVQAISMLIGHGAASVVSLRLGEGRREEADRTMGCAVALALAAGILVVAAVGLFLRPVLALCGGTGAALDYAVRFTGVLLPGLFLQVLAFVLNNLIRGRGDPATAFKTMAIGVAVNGVLNPLFIFGLRLGVAGSALATDIAQAVSVAWLVAVYASPRRGFRIRLSTLGFPRGPLGDILTTGAAPCFMQTANGVFLVVTNNLVGAMGGAAGLTVIGIATALLNLTLMPVIGIRSGVQPIIGFNYGAGLYGRVRDALRIALVAAVVFCAGAYALFFAFSRDIVAFFVKGAPPVVALGTPALRMFLSSLPAVGVAIIGSVYFQAIKKGPLALLINAIRQLLVLVPAFVLLPRLFGLTGVWLAPPVSDSVSVVFTLALLLPESARLKRLEGTGSPPLVGVPA